MEYLKEKKIRISDAELTTAGLFEKGYPIMSNNSSEWKGWIIYDDFNFDGNWDFAVQYKIRKNCRDPFYKVYLSDGKGFYYSNSFTKLATDQCEMFKIDRIKKRLFTHEYIKDDNGWGSVYNEYIIRKGEPVIIESIERKNKWSNEMVVYITTTKIHDGKISVANSNENILYAEGIVNIFSFETENGKKINIYFECSLSGNNDLSGYIGYILLDNNENVEFIYPILGKMKSDFIYKKTKNENTEYTIYENNGKIGIKIFSDGKNYNWKGSHVIQGDLNKINDFDIKNITIQD